MAEQATDRASTATPGFDVASHDWRMLIGGELVAAASGATYESISPVTLGSLARVPAAGPADIDVAVRAANAAFPAWRVTSDTDRARRLQAILKLLRQHEDELASLDAIDGGNPVTAMKADVNLAIALLELAVHWAASVRGDTVPGAPTFLHYTVREPYGVVGRIIPYNHPLLFATRAMVPLLVGNTVVLKAPDQTPLSALRLGELIADVIPPGVFNIVSGLGAEAGDALVRHEDVRRIAFTGSPQTGRAIQRAAAESDVKVVTLELGGKNAMIVFPDADLHAAARGAVRGMNFHWTAGQSCGPTSRLLVHSSIKDDLLQLVRDEVAQIRVGSPCDPTTEMGPLVSGAQLDKVQGFIREAEAAGASVLCGGGYPTGVEPGGCFIEPTVLADVAPGSRVGQEEIFGPVLSAMTWDAHAEAIAIANGTRYGLTASVWTTDIAKGHRVARELDAGYVWVNTSSAHYPGMPFGGFKNSGVGREEDAAELLSYTQTKSINVALGGD